MLLDNAVVENPDEYQRHMPIYVQASILYSFVWGLAGVLDTGSREKFDAFIKSVSTKENRS